MYLSIPEQSEQLIENINIFIDATQHLDEKYRDKLFKMNHKMNDFVQDYLNYSSLSISEYASFLNHDALSPLTIVLGYAELFRSAYAHILTDVEVQFIDQICAMMRTLTDSVRQECLIMVSKREQLLSEKS